MLHKRGLNVALAVMAMTAVAIGLAGCDEEEQAQVQQSKWVGDGWAVFGSLPQKDAPLIASIYNQYKTDPATRFVDASLGASAAGNNGSEAAPWGTIAQAKSKIKGEKVSTLLFKCGSVFNETFALGAADVDPSIAKLRIGMYGNCTESTRPVISGSELVNAGWSPESQNSLIQVRAQPGAAVMRMFYRDVAQGLEMPLRLARFPNHAEAGGGYGQARAATQNVSDVANKNGFYLSTADRDQLAAKGGGTTLTGATVYVRTVAWMVERGTVAAYDPTTGKVDLTLPQPDSSDPGKRTTALANPVQNNTGYYFEGKPWMLDAPGEWVHADGVLRVRMPNDALPNAADGLRASVRNEGLQIYMLGKPIEIEGIRAQHQGKSGFNIGNLEPVMLRAVESVYSGDFGILLVAPDSTITESHVLGSGNTGILMRGSGNAITNNVIADTARYFDSTAGAADNSSSRVAVGVRVDSPTKGVAPSNIRVAGNIVHRVGSAGISFQNGVGLVIENNTVVSPCMRFSDCGGISTFNTHDSAVTVPAEQLAVIRGNHVVGVAPTNFDGYAQTTARNQNVGIYLDELTNRVTVENNDVASSEVGIYLHKARFNTIRGNRVRAVSHAAFKASSTNLESSFPAPNNLVTDNIIEDNVFFSRRVQSLTPTGEIYTVDGVVLTNNQGNPYFEHNRDQVYAQMWTLLNVNDGADVFFGPQGRNISRRNTVHTLTPSVNRWRQDPWENSGVREIVRDAPALWATRKNSERTVKMSLEQWKSFSASADDQESDVGPYKAYRYTGALGSELIQNGVFTQGAVGWSVNGSAQVTALPAADPSCGVVPCARVVGMNNYEALFSSPFSLTPGKLYRMRYDVAAGDASAKHRSFTNRPTSPWGSVGLNVPSMSLPAKTEQGVQYRFMEILFRATSADTAQFVMWPHDGSIANAPAPQPPVYVRRVSLKEVPGIEFLPATNSLVTSVANVYGQDMSITCEDAGLQGRCDVQGEDKQPVQWPLLIKARTTKMLFQRDANWMNSPS